MTDDSDTPPHLVELKHRIASGLHDLNEEVSALQPDLHRLQMADRDDAINRTETAAAFRTSINVIDAQFQYVTRLVEAMPDSLFTIPFTDQPDDSLAAIVENAHEQFREVVAPVPDALENDEFESTEWARFYGSGYGHSYSFALNHVTTHCVDAVTDDEANETVPASQSESSMRPDEQPVESESATTTQSSEPTTDTESPEDTSDESEDEWPEYVGEYIQTPEGDKEPLATEAQLPKRKPYTILDVEYSMVLEPPCKYACPNEGRYLLKFRTDDGIQYARLCTNHLPKDAAALARSHRFWKEGSMQTEGETYTTLKRANSSSTEWIERHAVSDGRSGGHDLLARLTYRLRGDTLYISVQDCVTEHGREGGYSVDIDEWDGALPYINGQPIGDWLIDQAETHRERLLTREGVERHLVSIDQDKRVIERAQRAYREKNPDFSQPSGMINDHTPVVESCIPVCAECGEIVAGITPDDAEPCEYCGSEDAEWRGATASADTDSEAAT